MIEGEGAGREKIGGTRPCKGPEEGTSLATSRPRRTEAPEWGERVSAKIRAGKVHAPSRGFGIHSWHPEGVREEQNRTKGCHLGLGPLASLLGKLLPPLRPHLRTPAHS